MKLLVIRFSALGDVAMTVPVIDAVARTWPQAEITVLSRPFVQPLFARMPANVRFRGVDLDAYKGLGGLFRLYRELKKENAYEAVADLHDVLRTRVLRFLFRLGGLRTAHIDKGRKGRKALVRPEHKIRKQLPTSFQRYADVFRRLGLPAEVHFRSIYEGGQGETRLFADVAGKPDGTDWIGFAPFAAHRGKQLPENTARSLIRLLARRPGTHLFLFGGKADAPTLEQWARGLSPVTVVAGKLKLEQELALMSHLKLMVSMDSANMHLASLAGIPVVSVWGATHPLAGFMGWNQRTEWAVQTDTLACRPCSIFGNKPCLRGDYACLARLTAEDILYKISLILNKNNHA